MKEEKSDLIDPLDFEKFKAKPEETLKEHTDRVLACAQMLCDLGYVDEDKVENSLLKSAKYHDVGKANKLFQERLLSKKKFDKNEEVPHNILSYFMTEFDLGKYENQLEAYAIINHHHYTDNFHEIARGSKLPVKLKRDLCEIFSERESSEVKKQIMLRKKQANSIKRGINEKIENEDLTPIKVLGFLNKCDYAASAHLRVEHPADFLEDKIKNWSLNNNIEFNDLQKFCSENRDENICVIGSTGMGKTEGALLWIGNNKGFFVLPLKTAINSIYDRVINNIVECEDISKRVALLHGDTLDVYQKICDNGVETLKETDIIEYFNESKKYSIPLNITTPDQIFNFVFRYSGYELKYAMMSYSKIVIDEIQAYGADLLSVLILGIQEIIDIGGKVSIFTATLPPFILDLISRKSKNGEIIDKYNFKKEVFLNPAIRHNLQVEEKEIAPEDIISHYKENKGKRKKYLVVCNTIKKAQELYSAISEELGEENVKMLHSKYIKKHRREKEEQIISDGETFEVDENGNKTGKIDEKDVIWISTQIVEASLDIDFDYLFTEMSDLNGLFQRLGRVNRKGKKNIDEPNAYVYTEINEKILVKAERDKGFIDKAIYELSKEAIKSHGNGKISEEEKQELIETFLTTEKLEEKGSAFLEDYWELYNYYRSLNSGEISIDKAQRKLRNIISYDVFPVDEEGNMLNNEEITELCEKMNELKEEMKKVGKTQEEKNKLILEYEKTKNKIYDYSVSVGYYDINTDMYDDKIEISKGRNIYKSKCKYDDKTGYIRIKKEKTEDTFDAFI